jgi:CRISPR-associated endoribonuclease Cas6
MDLSKTDLSKTDLSKTDLLKTDLLSLLLTLRAQTPGPVDTPTWWGRAAHALLLEVVRGADPQLAQRLHEDNSMRPFTASTLMGRFPGHKLDPGERYNLRLTSLEPGLSGLLLEAAQNGPLTPGSLVELERLPFRVEAVLPGPDATLEQPPIHPWAGMDSYQELGAAYLLARQPPPRRLELQFTSPTTFKSGGMHVPVPLPELVFGSLLERWNRFAPIQFPEEGRRYAAECLALGRYRLSSRVAPLKAGGLRVGAVGDVQYTCLNYDRYWMSVMAVLAAYARYAGAGAGTSMGLGQCRRIERLNV